MNETILHGCASCGCQHGPGDPLFSAESPAVKTESARRIAPRWRQQSDEGGCCVCGSEELHAHDDVVATFESGERHEIGAAVCARCLDHLRDGDKDLIASWLEVWAGRLRARADFLDRLRETPPEIAEPAEWERWHTRARARGLVAHFASVDRFTDDDLLVIGRVLGKVWTDENPF